MANTGACIFGTLPFYYYFSSRVSQLEVDQLQMTFDMETQKIYN